VGIATAVCTFSQPTTLNLTITFFPSIKWVDALQQVNESQGVVGVSKELLLQNRHYTYRALAGGFECNRLWVLKKVPQQNAFSSASMPSAVLLSPFDYVAAGRTGVVGRLRKRTSRLMF
jgi:hypothetical protein